MIKARHACLIRIGIMARCLPYKTNKEPDPVFGGYFTILDLTRLQSIQDDWAMHNNNQLTQRAYERTKPWISTRYV